MTIVFSLGLQQSGLIVKVFTEKKGAWPQIMADSRIKRLHFDKPKLQSHITYLKRKSKTPTSQQPSSQQILKNISRSSREEEKDEDEDIEFEDVSSIIDYWANKEPESNEEEDKSQPISESSRVCSGKKTKMVNPPKSFNNLCSQEKKVNKTQKKALQVFGDSPSWVITQFEK
jgi:hypothetical protein